MVVGGKRAVEDGKLSMERYDIVWVTDLLVAGVPEKIVIFVRGWLELRVSKQPIPCIIRDAAWQHHELRKLAGPQVPTDCLQLVQ